VLHSLISLVRRVGAGPIRLQVRRKTKRWVVALVLVATALGGRLGLQLILYSQVSGKTGTPEERETLFQLLRPVPLANCQLERFGETYDGGYLLCSNLLKDVQAGYSYGISGYDKWGCDVSTTRGVPVHQYDCFNLKRPVCAGGTTIFHEECVGEAAAREDGRPFDTMQSHVARNGDSGKHIVLKIDVEGAEWGAFLAASDELLSHIDQIAVEFHGIDDRKSVAAVRRLKQFFEVANIHYNNFTCFGGMKPFASWAYEVLFVNKRLAVVDAAVKTAGVHPLAAPNIPFFLDCQPADNPLQQ
jgi:hypothetical protein